MTNPLESITGLLNELQAERTKLELAQRDLEGIRAERDFYQSYALTIRTQLNNMQMFITSCLDVAWEAAQSGKPATQEQLEHLEATIKPERRF